MNNEPRHAGPTAVPIGVSLAERTLFGALVLAVVLFFWWTMNSTHRLWRWGPQNDYYSLLVHGWLDGHLYMKAEVPEALLKIADPYDPAQRGGLGLHDATFYQGKYYIYFGVAPAAVLLLPFRVLTGTDLPSDVAVWLLVTGGFLASAALWWQVRRRYFPAASVLASLTGVVMIGLGGLGTVLLRRPTYYELAIAGAYFFAMVALWCAFRVLHAARRQGWWMAGASLAAGLAVGSRPSYVIGAPLAMLPLLWWWWRRERRECRDLIGSEEGELQARRRKIDWAMIAAAVVPLGCCGALLALHNYLRFGSPFEFGVRYMFSGIYESKVTHFTPAFMGHNLGNYFLATPRLREWFPFMESKGWPQGPAGYMAGDGYYGVIPTMPVVLLGPLGLAVLWWRRAESETRLRVWLSTVGFLFAGVIMLLTGFYSSAGRYQVDFAPALVLAGCVGLLVVERWLTGLASRGLRWAGRALLGVMLVWSLAFALMLSFQANDEFRGHNQPGFRRVARWFNVVPGWLAAWRGDRFGPVELRVRFPTGHAGHREPLVTTGTPGRGGFFLVNYLEDGRVRFGFESWGSATLWSEPLAIDYAAEHDVQVVFGALVGPPRLGDAQEESVRKIRMKFDGRVIWEAESDFHPAGAKEVYFGQNPIGGTAAEPFGGTVLGVKRGG